MSRHPHYPIQDDDLGCFALLGCLAACLAILIGLARAASWVWNRVAG